MISSGDAVPVLSGGCAAAQVVLDAWRSPLRTCREFALVLAWAGLALVCGASWSWVLDARGPPCACSWPCCWRGPGPPYSCLATGAAQMLHTVLDSFIVGARW